MADAATTSLAASIDAWVQSSRPESGDVWFEDATLSAEDWQALEGYEWSGVELIEGRVRMAPSPSDDHQTTSMGLSLLIGTYVREHGLGRLFAAPFEISLAGKTSLQPDLLWFPAGHPRLSSKNRFDPNMPSLVVEILSPGNHRFDSHKKKSLYLEAAIPHYWIVDPMRKDIEAYELQDGRYVEVGDVKDGIFQGPPFPELEIPLAEIFPA